MSPKACAPPSPLPPKKTDMTTVSGPPWREDYRREVNQTPTHRTPRGRWILNKSSTKFNQNFNEIDTDGTAAGAAASAAASAAAPVFTTVFTVV